MIKECHGKILLCLLFFACCSVADAQHERDSNIVYWTFKPRLSFHDFTGDSRRIKKDSASRVEKESNLGAINLGIQIFLKTTTGKTEFRIYAAMKKNLSWVRTDDDSLSLRHEQGHFDICEIYARKLRMEIPRARSLEEARKIYDKMTEEEDEEHEKYDEANTVNAGGITRRWRQKINERLKELEGYQNPLVVLPIDK